MLHVLYDLEKAYDWVHWGFCGAQCRNMGFLAHSWIRDENRQLLECYYLSNPSRKGYMQWMWDQLVLRNPTSKLTKKWLLAQCSNIRIQKLVSQQEIHEVQGYKSGGRCHHPYTPGLGTKPQKQAQTSLTQDSWPQTKDNNQAEKLELLSTTKAKTYWRMWMPHYKPLLLGTKPRPTSWYTVQQ